MTGIIIIMSSIEAIDAFHMARKNQDWVVLDPAEKTAALFKAQDYQRAYYPVRDDLTDHERETLDIILALLAEQMMVGVAVRQERGIKTEKLSDGEALIETVYDPAISDPFPLITALWRPLTPRVSSSGGIRSSRMRP